MVASRQVKEEFYIRRVFDDNVPIFVEATEYARKQSPYPLSSKKALKATCGVRTDNGVVAFSLRTYTARQAEKEVENVTSTVEGRRVSRNVLHPRMPRRTLHELITTAHVLSEVLGDEVIVEHDGRLHVLKLIRTGEEADLRLTGLLTETEDGYVRSEAFDAVFTLPVARVHLRIFLRSPIRDRILAYAFNGYLDRKPGRPETVVRATAMALNSLIGLATFRMLSGLDRVRVPPAPLGGEIRPRTPEERVIFRVPVLLFTDEGVPAARGHVGAEIDLDRVDPVTGDLIVHITEGEELEWNPALAGTAKFQDYGRVLAETISAMVNSALGTERVHDLAYDIMLSSLSPEALPALRAAVSGLPGLAAKPSRAEVRLAQPTP